MLTMVFERTFTLFSFELQSNLNPIIAYIDPATTSYIIQIIAGLLISLSLGFTLFVTKFKAGFFNLRIKFLQLKYLREARKQEKQRDQTRQDDSTNTASDASATADYDDLVRAYDLVSAIDDGPTGEATAPFAEAEQIAASVAVLEPPAPTIRTRLQYLFADTRRFKQRWLASLLVVFASIFTVFIFGILDLYAINSSYFPFVFRDLVGPVLLLALGLTLLISLVIASLRGRVFDAVLSLIFGIFLAAYIQGNFLNLDLGQLTGDPIPWSDYRSHALLNLLIWGLVILIPLVLRYLKPRLWQRTLMFLSIILIAAQAVALTNTVVTRNVIGEKNQNYLSTRGMLELGSEENVIVILLDRLDQNYIEDMLEEDPQFYDGLDGFTRFTNNVTAYARTYPSAAHLLTGELNHYAMPAERYFTSAWQGTSFFPDLKDAGFETKLYMVSPYTYNDISQLEGVADNIDEELITIDHRAMLERMITLSNFRYVPHALKASFQIGSNDFASVAHVENGDEYAAPYKTDDAYFMDLLEGEGLSIGEQKNNFTYLHLNGMHDNILDENADRLPDGEKGSQSLQMKATFKIVMTYLDQLKELGLYEDSTIIITGDHGKSRDRYNLDYAITTGLFVKPKGVAGTPLAINHAPVTSEMLRSTVIQEAGLNADQYGQGYFDIPEDEDCVRYSYYRVDDRENKYYYVEKFEIQGDARDFDNWKKVDEFPIKYLHG